MRLTNRLNLPQALVDAVANDDYTKGEADFSVTQLIRPMRAVVLEELYADEIVEDVSDRLWSLYGQEMHSILERANRDKEVVTERRLYMGLDGIRISGSMDHYNVASAHLIDWKFTTCWKFTGNKDLSDWEAQTNCYAELLRVNGHRIETLEIIGVLRDWSMTKAAEIPDYPKVQVVRRPVPLWSSDEVRNFLRRRVAEYGKAKEQLPSCSDKERWARGVSGWAVTSLKPGSTAPWTVKKHATEAEALAHMENLQKKYPDTKYSVEFKPAPQVRCEFYCNVAPFCDQFKALKGNK